LPSCDRIQSSGIALVRRSPPYPSRYSSHARNCHLTSPRLASPCLECRVTLSTILTTSSCLRQEPSPAHYSAAYAPHRAFLIACTANWSLSGTLKIDVHRLCCGSNFEPHSRLPVGIRSPANLGFVPSSAQTPFFPPATHEHRRCFCGTTVPAALTTSIARISITLE